MVIVTFIRHGESVDNLKTIWAGWKDAPLSNHGMAQARALGDFFSGTQPTTFTAIIASPLKRAFTTAQAVYDAHPAPKPPFTTSLLIREQHFGIAEGNLWSLRREKGLSLEEHYQQGLYPVLYERHEKFPEGESLNDLKDRAERAMDELVMPFVWDEAKSKTKGETSGEAHLAVVSHGLCISELVAALMRKNAGPRAQGNAADKWTGLLNTAWTRVTIRVDSATVPDPTDSPRLQVEVTHVNAHGHLDKVKRQPGGISRVAHDPAQTDIRNFFGGGGVAKDETQSESLEEGRSSSNVYDETKL